MDSELLGIIGSIMALIILLILGTYFSATEMAFSSLNRARIKNLADSGGKKGKRAALVSELYEKRFDEVISTLLICNNTVAITSATVSVALFVRLIGEWGYLVSTVLISAIVIVLTDILPKSVSKDQPEKIAIQCVPFLNMLVAILKPINWGVVKIKNTISAYVVTELDENVESEQTILGQELKFMVDEAASEGSLSEEDSTLITNAIEFNELTAGDIVTPRVEIVSIPMHASNEEIVGLFLESGYSRMPVYEESLDNIKGVVHLRDFLRCMINVDGGVPATLQEIIVPAIFTVTSARIPELLKKLKEEHRPMAVVTDEYGGTEGIITVTDILERLVGDIWDENDDHVEDFIDLGNNQFKVLCNAYIDDMFSLFDIKAESESNTVGGWIMDILRRIPEEGDTFDFENTLRVTVTKAVERKAEECLVEVLVAVAEVAEANETEAE